MVSVAGLVLSDPTEKGFGNTCNMILNPDFENNSRFACKS